MRPSERDDEDMRWAEFERHENELGALGRGMLGEPGVVLVASIRVDGTRV